MKLAVTPKIHQTGSSLSANKGIQGNWVFRAVKPRGMQFSNSFTYGYQLIITC